MRQVRLQVPYKTVNFLPGACAAADVRMDKERVVVLGPLFCLPLGGRNNNKDGKKVSKTSIRLTERSVIRK